MEHLLLISELGKYKHHTTLLKARSSQISIFMSTDIFEFVNWRLSRYLQLLVKFIESKYTINFLGTVTREILRIQANWRTSNFTYNFWQCCKETCFINSSPNGGSNLKVCEFCVSRCSVSSLPHCSDSCITISSGIRKYLATRASELKLWSIHVHTLK